MACARPTLSVDRGFSLIEIAVVLAIIAILAALALPDLSHRIIREQVVEGAKLADVAKTPVGTAWVSHLPLPVDNAAAGLPPPQKVVGNMVQSVTVEDGAIHVTFGFKAHERIRGRTLSFRPAVVQDARVVPVAWLCGQAQPVPGMRAMGRDRTDLQPEYLPLNCHAPR